MISVKAWKVHLKKMIDIPKGEKHLPARNVQIPFYVAEKIKFQFIY